MILAQKPNVIVSIALGAWFVTMFLPAGIWHDAGQSLSVVATSAWAYDEIRYGVNWFRRGLGGVVIISVFYNLVLALHGR